MAQGDPDGGGQTSTVLLERRKVRIGRLSEKGFEERLSCGLGGQTQATRIFFFDVDGDGREELIVSAVENGLPASLVLKVDGEACRTLVSRARWSLRVIDVPEGIGEHAVKGRALVGQAWSTQSFFSGPIREMALKGDRLVSGRTLDLPKRAALFEFAYLPATDGAASVAVLKGWASLEVYGQEGRRWKRRWRSGERFGGSANAVAARQRPALDEVASDNVIFGLPPIGLVAPQALSFLAVKQEMPTRGIVGREPYVRGGEVVGFVPDPAFTFAADRRTQAVPGAIVDAIIGTFGTSGGAKLLVLFQEDVGAFEIPQKSSVLAFEMW